jgi:hypothetical protein
MMFCQLMHHNVWNGFPKYTTKEFEKKSEPTETGSLVWFLEIYLKFRETQHIFVFITFSYSNVIFLLHYKVLSAYFSLSISHLTSEI